MAEQKNSIVDLDRENLCEVDGVVFEKEGYRQYIREEHRPHPVAPGVRSASAPHPAGSQPLSSLSSVCAGVSSAPASSRPGSFPGSLPNSFSGSKIGSSSGLLGYGLDLI